MLLPTALFSDCVKMWASLSLAVTRPAEPPHTATAVPTAADESQCMPPTISTSPASLLSPHLFTRRYSGKRCDATVSFHTETTSLCHSHECGTRKRHCVTQRLADVTGPDTVRCFVAEVSVGGVRL